MTFKQVEYLVYWIDKMQLVEGRVPIPNSKSLLFENDLGDIVSAFLESASPNEEP